MQLFAAIRSWSRLHGSSLSAATKRDIRAIASATKASGRDGINCREVTTSDREAIAAAVPDDTDLSSSAIDEFLSIVIGWGTSQSDDDDKDSAGDVATAAAAGVASGSDDEVQGGDKADPVADGESEDPDADVDESDDDIDDEPESDDDTDDDDSDDDTDDEPESDDDTDHESDDDTDDDESDDDTDDDESDDDADDEPGVDTDDDDESDDDTDDDESDDDTDDDEPVVEIKAGSSAFSQEIISTRDGDGDDADGDVSDQPDDAGDSQDEARRRFTSLTSERAADDGDELASLTEATDDGLIATPSSSTASTFSRAAEPVARPGTDWWAVFYFSVAAICFAILIWLYVSR